MTDCTICGQVTCERHRTPAVFRVSFLFTVVRGYEFVREEVDVCWDCAEFLESDPSYTGIDFVGLHESP